MKRLVLIAALVVVPAVAHAYPQFQLSTGAQRCNQCHIGPAGGTLINNYGRDEAGDTISRGGSGAFLHGLWTPPEPLALGADVRLAGLVYGNGGSYSPSVAMFPMLADAYANLHLGDFWIGLAAGYLGSTRGGTTQVANAFNSREHYVMWRKKSQGPYLRAGKFRVPWGLRLAEHPFYDDRANDQNLEEETYGLSGGWVKNEWEAHGTVYTGDPLRPTGGAAAYFERRQGGSWLWGAQARSSWYPDERGGWSRHTFGGLVKYWLGGPKVLVMGEVDVGAKIIPDAHYTNKELMLYTGATWFPVKGVMITASGETFLEDVGTPGTSRVAGNLEAQYFPWAHVEVVLLGRVTETSALSLLQLHYYL